MTCCLLLRLQNADLDLESSHLEKSESTTDLLTRKLPFARLVREVAIQDFKLRDQ